MSENSTNAPKTHNAAAPASKNAPGKRIHAEYQGGCTESPRSNTRPAPKTSAATITAGAASPIAHSRSTAPVAAPSSGCPPAAASAAGTAKAISRKIALGGGTLEVHDAGRGGTSAGNVKT